MANLDRDAVLEISKKFRLQWEPAQQAYVLLYAEGMIKLNSSAAEVLKRFDGKRTLAAVIEELQRQFPNAAVESDVREFANIAHDQGWIKIKQPA
jgi:pyrroloquinoline quinone biosynthesis protein D